MTERTVSSIDNTTPSTSGKSKSQESGTSTNRFDVNVINTSATVLHSGVAELSLQSKPNMSTAANDKLDRQNSLHVYTEMAEFGSCEMRPRSRTIPSTYRKGPALILPEITVEDFSDQPSSLDPAQTDTGVFHVFASPPRRRAHTCPDDLFRRRKNSRPPTPPPFVPQKGPSKGRNKFNFQRKKLTQLTEDSHEPTMTTPPVSAAEKPSINWKPPSKIGLEGSTQKLSQDAFRSPHGYTFTGSNTTYTARPPVTVFKKGQDSFRNDFTTVARRRANPLTDGEPSHVRSWRRGWETEVIS